MKKFYLTLTAILLAVILISCNKSDTGANLVNNEGSNGKGASILGNIPTISSISPTSAEIGDLLTITGTNLGKCQGTGDFVSINGIKATVYKSWIQTQIKVLVPSGSLTNNTGKVSVTSCNKKSNEVNFNLLQSSPVTIGTQIWMGYNLDVSTYRNGDPILQVADSATWANLTTGAWCWYNNDPANGAIFGKLYNWYAVNDPRGLAPVGWHIATDGEFKTLSIFLGMTQAEADQYGFAYFGTVEGGKLKEAGSSLWYNPNIGATNSSSFTALPGGMRSLVTGNNYVGRTGCCVLWCSTNYNDRDAWVRCLDRNSSRIYRNYLLKSQGFSVRCVRDN